MVFQPHQVVFSFCLVFVVLSVMMAVYLIYNHLRHFTEPRFQKPIVRILLMVPVRVVTWTLARAAGRFLHAACTRERSDVRIDLLGGFSSLSLLPGLCVYLRRFSRLVRRAGGSSLRRDRE